MINSAVSTNEPPKAAPAVIVLGRDDSGKPHASWFDEAAAPLAEKAAAMMGMAALRAATGELRALAGHLPQGRVFSTGRAFVPFVKASLFDQLAKHLPHPTPPPLRLVDDTAPKSPPATDKPANEAKPRQEPTSPDWSKIAAGDVVLAREAQDEGWFECRVLEAKADGLFILRWRDWPDLPKIVRRAEQVALLHPNHAAASN